MRRPIFRMTAAACLALAAPVTAQPSPAGLYRAQAGPDLAAVLELAPDGRFRYELSEGALDEEASGRWSQGEEGLVLDTLPRPRPPEWQLNTIGETQEAPLTLTVKVPGGDSMAGIFVRVGFTNGDRAAGMTQHEGWSMAPDDERQPAWIEFSEPIHDANSPRFPLPARRGMALHVTLVPNEIGVAAFKATPITVTSEGLVLHWRGQDIVFVRAGRSRGGR